ncbi:MAG: carboxypeptidase regulatory-like domain-containing protein [Acidobacteria bacterium]|nr:carboxypeptidase regulatory-like domain-containing protein [Acidobacteriota bacterium]
MRKLMMGMCLAAAGLASFAGAPGRLRGEVRDPRRAPIPGARIVATRSQAPPVIVLTATDQDGLIVVDQVPEGSYRVEAVNAGFTASSVGAVEVGGPFRAVADLVLRPGVEKVVTVELPAGDGDARLHASVVDDEGRPLAGALVRLQPVDHRADPAEGRTARDGTVELGPLPAGSWRLVVSRAGWTRLTVPEFRWPGGPLNVIARLLPLPEGAREPLEDLLPPPRLVTPTP